MAICLFCSQPLSNSSVGPPTFTHQYAWLNDRAVLALGWAVTTQPRGVQNYSTTGVIHSHCTDAKLSYFRLFNGYQNGRVVRISLPKYSLFDECWTEMKVREFSLLPAYLMSVRQKRKWMDKIGGKALTPTCSMTIKYSRLNTTCFQYASMRYISHCQH